MTRAAMRQWERPSLLLVGGLLVALTLVALPVILQELTRDWTAYAQAADRLKAGQPLYIWTLPTPDDEYYLYPPGMAVAWAFVGSPSLLLVVKVVSLLAVGVLAQLVVEDRANAAKAAVLIAAGSLLWAPNVYDLVLGNVMALWTGALAVVIARRGWAGAAPLGIVLALAAKPAILPFAIWLLLRRPGDALRVAAVGLAASAVAAAAFGPGRYVEYLLALPAMSTLATVFTGNVGLVTVSPQVALAAMVGTWVLAAVVARAVDERRGAAIVLASMLLAQPTIGFNYAGLLFPALVLLWGADRPIGTLAFVLVTLAVLVSPVGAAVVLIVLALASWGIETRARASGVTAAPPAVA